MRNLLCISLLSGCFVLACGTRNLVPIGGEPLEGGSGVGPFPILTPPTQGTAGNQGPKTPPTATDAGPSTSPIRGPTTFAVLRAGELDGTILHRFEAQAFIDEYNVDGRLLRSIAVPFESSGHQHGLVIQPYAASASQPSPTVETNWHPEDGLLTRSVDGRYLVLAGYMPHTNVEEVPAPPGPGSMSSARPRVIARVDSTGAVDTSTAVPAFGNGNIAGAVTNDGTAFWSVGTKTSDPIAVMYTGLGGADGTVVSDSGSLNGVGIFDGNLYVASGPAFQTWEDIPRSYCGIQRVGTGLPTTSGQELVGVVDLEEGSPYGFQFIDTDDTPGVDTLYVADGMKGIRKLRLNTATGAWTAAATFTDGLPPGAFGVAALRNGSEIILFATSIGGDRIVKYVDDGVNTSPVATRIATAMTYQGSSYPNKGFAYRGVALSATP